MRLFISSTFKDLRPERQAVIEVLQRVQSVPWGMEYFASSPKEPIEVALHELELSDAVVLIVGFKAGSLIPESPSLTYTAAEFRRAKELGRSIFAFIQTETGTWRNKESTEALKLALDNFKKEVDAANVTAAYFENPDKLQIEVLVAIQKWNEEGRPGARLVFATPMEFFAPYRVANIPRLFDFAQVLRGRNTEMNALNGFIASAESAVGVLLGRGGIGKSKLLHDWSKSVPAGTTVIYVREDAEWHGEAGKEIPGGNIVIVADDAHRISFLDALLTLIRILRSRQRNIKIILGARPSGASQIDASLATRFEVAQIQRFALLQRIGNQSVVELAQESLGPAHLGHALALAAISGDTPLVTVVGGRLIARGEISPALLANETDFRHEVFDRFTAEYERLLPAGPVNWRALLNLIAAASPLDPSHEKFLEPTAKILRVHGDEVRSATDQLERNGLLLRGGRLVRIVPDLLSDFLLEQACVTSNGDSTGFADRVFGDFGVTYLSNILRNLGELDFRITHVNHNIRLLARIWEDIRTAFENSDASGRVDLLKSLREAAWFQPAQVRQIVRRAMETEAAETAVLATWKITQEYVFREIPDLLQAIAHHIEHFEDATRALWELTRISNRDHPSKQPPNGWHALEALAEYGRYKPVALNIRMADMIAEFSRTPEAFDGAHTPLDLADKLLAKEGQYTEQDGYTISFGSFPFNYAVVKPARGKALALVEQCLTSENSRLALRSLRSISHVLSGFLPMVGRVTDPQESVWQDAEREIVLGMLERRLRKQPLPVPVQRKIRSVLLQSRPRTRNIPLVGRIDSILAAAPQTDDVLIFDAFCSSPWDHDGQFETIEAADLARRTLLDRAVKAFQTRYASPQEQINALVQLVADAGSAGIDLSGKCGDFMERLCLDPKFLEEFVRYLLDDPDRFLGQMICFPLTILRANDPTRYRELGLRGAEHRTVTVGIGTSSAVCYGPILTSPIAEDMAIIGSLSKHTNWWVRHNTFLGIGRIGAFERYERAAVELAINTNIEDHSELAEDMCGAFGPARIRFEALREDELRTVLHKFVSLDEVDGYHAKLFLDRAGHQHPSALFAFLIERLDRAAAIWARGESLGEYVPIPGHGLGSALHSLQRGPDYSNFLAQIRDRFVTQINQRYWLGQIFWNIGTIDVTTLSSIDDLLHSKDEENVRAAVGLIGDAPSGLALSRPYFAVHMLEVCEELDRDLLGQAMSVLIGNSHTGPFQRTPGSPSPKFQQMEERAAALRDLFYVGSVGHGFFSMLCVSAESVLERERLDDEQFGFK